MVTEEAESKQIQKVLAAPPRQHKVLAAPPRQETVGQGMIPPGGMEQPAPQGSQHTSQTQNHSSCPCRALPQREDLLLSGSLSLPHSLPPESLPCFPIPARPHYLSPQARKHQWLNS